MEVMPMYCIQCGFKNDDGARFCGKCGAPLIYDHGFDPDEITRGRGDETHTGTRASGGHRYGDDTSASRSTAGRQNYGEDIPESQRTDRSEDYGEENYDSRVADRNHRYGEDEGDDYSYISPASGKTHRNPPKKKKKTKGKEKTSSLRIILASLITLAFIATAGIMLYQVFSRRDPSPDIAPVEESTSGGQVTAQENLAEESSSTETDRTVEQPQESYMEIFDDEGSVIVVDGQSVPADSIDKPLTSSGTDGSSSAMEAAPAGGESAEVNAAVDMEPAEQGIIEESQQGSTQQIPTIASLLPIQAGPDLTGYRPVNVVNASASSTIVQEKTDNYPMLLFDGRDDSSWQEGVEGYGIGEWVSWNMDRKYNIKYIGFKMGNWASDYYYYGNARPKTIVLTAGDFTGQITFTNERAVQWVELSNEVTADSMRIQINDVFPGTTWKDTCITEILVYGK